MSNIRQPYRNLNFVVEIDGTECGYFSEVSGFEATVDTVDHHTGEPTNLGLPTLTHFSNITLKWGMVGDWDFLDWLKSVSSTDTEGPQGIVRKNMVVKMRTHNTQKEGPSWNIIAAWPVRYSIPDFNAMGSEVAVESIELVNEGFIRVDGEKDDGTPPQA